MADLTRAASRPAAPKSRVLVVRQNVKSVRRADEPDRLPVRLAIGVITAVGCVALVWLMGHIGFRLGFAQLMRASELRGQFADGIITGVALLIAIPRVIVQAGMAEPLWLMLGFLAVVIPAAGLSAARPATPGGPPPAQLAVVVSLIGAVTALVNATLLIWWTASPARLDLLRELPYSPADAPAWLRDLHTAAGLDVLVFVTAALWVVLVMRLMIPTWLRALSLCACLFALTVVLVAMSVSNAAAAQVEMGRSLVFLGDGSVEPRLLLGHAGQQTALLSVLHQPATPAQPAAFITVVHLLELPDGLEIVGRQSIIEMLESSAASRSR